MDTNRHKSVVPHPFGLLSSMPENVLISTRPRCSLDPTDHFISGRRILQRTVLSNITQGLLNFGMREQYELRDEGPNHFTGGACGRKKSHVRISFDVQ